MSEKKEETNELKTGADFHLNICPWMIGNEFAKRVLALLLFSCPENGEKMHLMLVGDPASGKSDVCRFIQKCITKSQISDKKTTPAGLFELIMECNGSVLISDEYDKIDNECRYMLLEVMNSHSITENKFGVHYTKNVSVNVVASLNPRNHVLTEAPLYLQVNQPLSLSTRFSMLLPFRQVSASHYGDIAVLHSKLKKEELVYELTMKIKEYVKSIREKMPSIIIDEKMTRMIGYYVQELKEYSSLSKIISPRTIEGFTSFLIARTRMMGRTIPDNEDFEYIKKLFNTAYR